MKAAEKSFLMCCHLFFCLLQTEINFSFNFGALFFYKLRKINYYFKVKNFNIPVLLVLLSPLFSCCVEWECKGWGWVSDSSAVLQVFFHCLLILKTCVPANSLLVLTHTRTNTNYFSWIILTKGEKCNEVNPM